MKNRINIKPRLFDCACRNLRMTTRVITQYYDNALKASGLKSTQFALLNEISSKPEGISVNELADIYMMDQTTVTRCIEILRKNGLVNIETEDKDSRKKRITLSKAGKDLILSVMPLWEEAQTSVEDAIGHEEYKAFLDTLYKLQKIR